jgi:uncharacterized protein YndB with AHSA1/START domain
MSDILHEFPVRASPDQVFRAVATPAGLDEWWTLWSSGEPVVGAEYEFGFGPDFNWRAVVTASEPGARFELELTEADEEWVGTRVGFDLQPVGGTVRVRFHHRGWPEAGDHYRTSSYCWAMYLRILRRYLEHGESVAYERRLDV